nr:hypothetical protein [Tanacetum cinerariifolium]
MSGGGSCITTLGTVLGGAWDDDLDDQVGSFDGGEGGGGRRRRTSRRWTVVWLDNIGHPIEVFNHKCPDNIFYYYLIAITTASWQHHSPSHCLYIQDLPPGLKIERSGNGSVNTVHEEVVGGGQRI